VDGDITQKLNFGQYELHVQ